MLPITFFPQVTICGTKDDYMKWSADEKHVTFKGRLNATQNGVRSIYIFNAFNEVADRIKRMKISPKSECTIIAEMREYIDKDNIRRQSFTIKMIDFIKTNESFERERRRGEKLDADKEPTQNNSLQPESASQNSFGNGIIDLDEFARSFSS